MQTNKLISTTLVTALAALAATGCTLQEASDTTSPASGTAPPAAQSAPAGGSPDGGGTTGSAAAPLTSATPAVGAEAHGPGDGHDHGGGAGPTAGAQAPAGGAGAAGAMPPMMGMGGNPTAPLTPTPALDKKIADAEKAGDKKIIAVAYAQRGTARMTDEASGPRVKYRAALDDYRKALAADPKNAEATKNKKQIEDIYTSMGRPIPGA